MSPGMRRVRRLVEAARQGSYTSIGCYPLLWLTSDGGVLHPKCGLENFGQVARSTRDKSRDGWAFEACDVNWEDPDLHCDHCGERIESAYAEDEAI